MDKWAHYIIYNALIPIVHINNILYKGVYPILSFACIILEIYLFYLGDIKITFSDLMGLIILSHYLVLLIIALIYGILLIIYFSFRKNKKVTLAVLALIALSILIFVATD